MPRTLPHTSHLNLPPAPQLAALLVAGATDASVTAAGTGVGIGEEGTRDGRGGSSPTSCLLDPPPPPPVAERGVQLIYLTKIYSKLSAK